MLAITDATASALGAAFAAVGAVLTALIVSRSRAKGVEETAGRVDQKLRNGTGELIATQVMQALHPQLAEIRSDIGGLHERMAVTERGLREIPKLTDATHRMSTLVAELNQLHEPKGTT